ncbi:hypothetical protein ACWD6L_05515 [Micromonospora profundi]|uniref:hypothetical protein n=1 Tax=Micromonospora TaxID=1873 RepID=UPI0012FA875A|nr:hypothetical protein [Micromonospora sp. NRRL B-16802]
MLVKEIATVLMIIAGLASIIWVANWPFNTPWEKNLTDEQRRINLAHNRRHHRAATRVMLPLLAVVLGLASMSAATSPKGNLFGAAVMGLCSVVCASVWVLLIKRGRRRRPSTQHRIAPGRVAADGTGRAVARRPDGRSGTAT